MCQLIVIKKVGGLTNQRRRKRKLETTVSSLAFAVELHVCHKNMKKHLRALHTALIITPFHTFQLLPPPLHVLKAPD